MACWKLISTVDPIALGGADSKENRATIFMLYNSIKSNRTSQQPNWKLFLAGNFKEYEINGIIRKTRRSRPGIVKGCTILNDGINYRLQYGLRPYVKIFLLDGGKTVKKL